MPVPSVHILTTGGTIAATPSGMLTPADLLTTIPDLDRLAIVTVEPFLDIGSSLITPTHWVALATRINTLWRERPDLSGIVVTHGTDTLEETAYFLHLTNQDPRPLVLTGAMRSANALSADGPANLRAAIVVAAAPSARERGALVLLNNEIHTARDVAKSHTLRLDAFSSGAAGLLGTIYENEISWLRPYENADSVRTPFALIPDQPLPRVDILYSYAGATGDAINAAVAAEAQGLVIAAFGSGRLTAGQISAIRGALAQGVIVVVSSRVGSGMVDANYAHNLAASAEGNGVVLAGDLNPQKARVLLLLALARAREIEAILAESTPNPIGAKVIQRIFANH